MVDYKNSKKIENLKVCNNNNCFQDPTSNSNYKNNHTTISEGLAYNKINSMQPLSQNTDNSNINVFLEGVELKGFNYVRNKFYNYMKEQGKISIAIKILEFTESVFKTWYYSKIEEIKDMGQFTLPECLSTQSFIDKYVLGDNKKHVKYSDWAWKNRHILGLSFLIYQFICKIKSPEFYNKSYFGFTGNLENRIIRHIRNALEHKINITPLNRAIREAFKLDKNYGQLLESPNSLLSFQDISDYLKQIKDTPKYYDEMSYIIKNIFRKNFDIIKVELTQGVSVGKAREKHYTRNYINSDGTRGTIWVNGLNGIEGGGVEHMFLYL